MYVSPVMFGGRGHRAARGPATGSVAPIPTERTGSLFRNSAFDPDAHGAGRAGDDLLRRLDRGGVQVRHLGLRDVADLGRGDGAHLGLVRLGAALVPPRGLLD